MQSVAVFCGANKGTRAIYSETARNTGRLLAEQGRRIVYGAGNIGLMGELADAALDAGGYVIGVIPYFLKEKEVCHENLTELHVVDSMHERKIRMAELSEAVLVLPGGYGTLDELFEMLTLAQLGQTGHPVGILNFDGYYDHLLRHLDHMQAAGFLKPVHRGLILDDHRIEPLLDRMAAYQPASAEGKWLDADRL